MYILADQLLYWVTFLPLISIGAAAFYAFFAAYCFRAFRLKYGHLFIMPLRSDQQYLVSFDAIRGLAASWVAISHGWVFSRPLFDSTQNPVFPWVGYGSKAVPIFVMLSGFLLYRSVKNAKTIADLRHYAYRRLLRVYPLYFISVCLGVITLQTPISVPHYVSELFMLRVFYFPAFTNPASWSLYVEMIFYAILPIVVIASTPKHMLTVSIFAIVVFLFADQAGSRELWLWKYFFIGIAASEVGLKYASFFTPQRAYSILGVGILLFLYDTGGPTTDWFFKTGLIQKNLAEYTIGIGVAFGLILVAAPYSKWFGKIMAWPPFRIIGVTSYSLFLLHPFVLWACFTPFNFATLGGLQSPFTEFPAAPWWYLPVVLMPAFYSVAFVSYVLVERPFLIMRLRKPKENVAAASNDRN